MSFCSGVDWISHASRAHQHHLWWMRRTPFPLPPKPQAEFSIVPVPQSVCLQRQRVSSHQSTVSEILKKRGPADYSQTTEDSEALFAGVNAHTGEQPDELDPQIQRTSTVFLTPSSNSRFVFPITS